MADITFDPPTIIGALLPPGGTIPKEMTQAFARHKRVFALLPFEVEKRFLKNTLACMRLMDIAGLILCDEHRTQIARHLSHLDRRAQRAGWVDAIALKGKTLCGFNLFGQLCLDLMRERGASENVLLIGESDWHRPIAGALLDAGWSVRALSAGRNLPRGVRRIRSLPDANDAPAAIIRGCLPRTPMKRLETLLREIPALTMIDLDDKSALTIPRRHRRISSRVLKRQYGRKTDIFLTSQK